MALNQNKMGKRKTTLAPQTKKNAVVKSFRGDFEELVGEDTYQTWINMLKELVPHGRTHRLAVVVAGMLYYTALQNRIEGNAVSDIFDEIDGMDYDDTESELMVVVERLFNDAKVKWKRTNSKGQGYSIAEESIREYFAWGDMPWE